MERIYNKLVRDNIPEVIINDNKIPHIRILDDVDYKEELYEKLLEEANEVVNSTSKEDLIEELADLYEVISSIKKLNKIDEDDILKKKEEKKSKRGGFDKKIFLEKTTDN